MGPQDRVPYGPGLDDPLEPPLGHVCPVQLVKLLTVDVRESRALVRAHEVPVLVSLNLLHEEVRDPEGREEVAAPGLLVTLVQAQVQKLEDVGVPWL